MATITDWKSDRKNKFVVLVKRPMVFNVFFTPPRWEMWIALCDNQKQALDLAAYHFYRSKENEILVSNTPLNKRQ